ncbi:MAG: hypothetical protein GXP42_00835 [Chloroflexi bacterium]|nr:hypothetical protein [Chloroflexota bacterium]
MSPSLQRKPEISILDIRQRVLSALSSDWEASSVEKINIQTDIDATYGVWMVTLNFQHQRHPYETMMMQIHVVKNPDLAQRLLPISPLGVRANEVFTPSSWHFAPRHANSYKMFCNSIQPQKNVCIAEVRYQEYVVYFLIPFANDSSLVALRKALEAVDRYMAEFLDSSTLSPGPRNVPAKIR